MNNHGPVAVQQRGDAVLAHVAGGQFPCDLGASIDQLGRPALAVQLFDRDAVVSRALGYVEAREEWAHAAASFKARISNGNPSRSYISLAASIPRDQPRST